MNRKTLNIILLATIILIAVIAASVWYIKSNQTVVSENPLTGQKEVSGGDTPRDPSIIKQTNYTPTLLSDQKIFDLGLRSSEYQAIIRSLDTYTKDEFGKKKYVVYTIDSSSVAYNSETRTFTFRMEVEKNSGTFYDVTVERPKFNSLILTLRDDGEVVYTETIKVNEKL